MSALEIKNDLLQLLVETDDAELLATVRNYFKKLKKQKAPKKPSKEAQLIEQIKATYSEKDNARYKALRGKLEVGSIAEKEQKELLKLTQKFESLDAQRLQNLIQLASLRKAPLNVIIKEFSISPANV